MSKENKITTVLLLIGVAVVCIGPALYLSGFGRHNTGASGCILIGMALGRIFK